jgi:antitoxin YefM
MWSFLARRRRCVNHVREYWAYEGVLGLREGTTPTPANGLEYWSMTMLPLSEVKAHLSEIAEEVATTHERVQVTKNGRDYVVLIAAEDLESMEATLELLSSPQAQARIASAEEDVARGDVLDEAEVRALVAARQGEPPE